MEESPFINMRLTTEKDGQKKVSYDAQGSYDDVVMLIYSTMLDNPNIATAILVATKSYEEKHRTKQEVFN